LKEENDGGRHPACYQIKHEKAYEPSWLFRPLAGMLDGDGNDGVAKGEADLARPETGQPLAA